MSDNDNHNEIWKHRLVALSPEHFPLGWLIVNLACLMATAVTLVDLLIATDDLAERPLASALYLVWNFGTTVVWGLEIGLAVWTIIMRNHDGFMAVTSDSEHSAVALPLGKRVELVLALYFTMDSLHLLWKWKIKKQDIEEELADVGINLIAYLYASYQSFRQTYQSSMHSSYEQSFVTESSALMV